MYSHIVVNLIAWPWWCDSVMASWNYSLTNPCFFSLYGFCVSLRCMEATWSFIGSTDWPVCVIIHCQPPGQRLVLPWPWHKISGLSTNKNLWRKNRVHKGVWDTQEMSWGDPSLIHTIITLYPQNLLFHWVVFSSTCILKKWSAG